MGPVSIIGLVTGIITFIDFSTKLIRGVHTNRLTEDRRTLENTVSEMQRLCSSLQADNPLSSKDEKGLSRVATECKLVAGQIVELLNKLKRKTLPKLSVL
jgi:hypothetical protein